uniref:RanBP2-type domain-containing protein n=1 Tax=Chlamydomonas euryale TaxID=1486919 RepID=A0A7R9VBY8_9CHLO
MTRDAAAAAALLLLLAAFAAPALAGDRQLMQGTTALEAMQQQCKPQAGGSLTEQGCKDCMANVDVSGYSDSKWACGPALCQKPAVWNNDMISDSFGSTDTDNCTACVSSRKTSACMICFENIPRKDGSGLGYEEEGDTPQTLPTAAAVTDARFHCWDVCATIPVGVAQQGMEANYVWACAQCSNLPADSDEYADCMECISSTWAEPGPIGILNKYEAAELAADPSKRRLNDFGACASKWNATFWVNRGVINPGGIYEQCVLPPKAPFTLDDVELSPAACVTCMDNTMDFTSEDAEFKQNENTSKAYACAQVCRDPSLIDTEAEATACSACVGDVDVFDAYGCQNCFKEFPDEAGASQPACLDCVRKNPYKGAVGSYNWACSQCAEIENADVRALCQQCILSPALDALSEEGLSDDFVTDPNVGFNDAYYAGLDSYLQNSSWVGSASELICSCVDMAKASLWGEVPGGVLSDWFTADCPNCTAYQKSCYRRKNITLASISPEDVGVLQIEIVDLDNPTVASDSAAHGFSIPQGYRLVKCDEVASFVPDLIAADADGCLLEGGVYDSAGTCDSTATVASCAYVTNASGWHLLHVDDNVYGSEVEETVADECSDCITEFETNDALPGLFSQGCLDYCMDEYLIHTTEQSENCFTCLYTKGALGTGKNNIAGCEACMSAINSFDASEYADVTAAREECFECLYAESEFATKDWECLRCAALSGDAKAACYQCVNSGTIDPGACVDGATRGWIFFSVLGECLDFPTLQTALADADSEQVYGSLGVFGTREECAEKAFMYNTLFGISNGGECFYFTSNFEFLESVLEGATGTAGTCDEACDDVAYANGLCGERGWGYEPTWAAVRGREAVAAVL